MCKLVELDNRIRVADIKADSVENIIQAASLCDDIQRIILFGSSIREDCTSESDIDIAVFGKKVQSRMFKSASYKKFLDKLYRYDDFSESYDILYFKDSYTDNSAIMQQIQNGVLIYGNA